MVPLELIGAMCWPTVGGVWWGGEGDGEHVATVSNLNPSYVELL